MNKKEYQIGDNLRVIREGDDVVLESSISLGMHTLTSTIRMPLAQADELSECLAGAVGYVDTPQPRQYWGVVGVVDEVVACNCPNCVNITDPIESNVHIAMMVEGPREGLEDRALEMVAEARGWFAARWSLCSDVKIVEPVG